MFELRNDNGVSEGWAGEGLRREGHSKNVGLEQEEACLLGALTESECEMSKPWGGCPKSRLQL